MTDHLGGGYAESTPDPGPTVQALLKAARSGAPSARLILLARNGEEQPSRERQKHHPGDDRNIHRIFSSSPIRGYFTRVVRNKTIATTPTSIVTA